MRTTPFKESGMSHDVRERFVNSSMQFVMNNRRNHFMIAKSDPLSD